MRQATRLGSIVRRAFATGSASSDASGSSAPSRRGRLALLALIVVALLAISAAPASATIAVELGGGSTGHVTSAPAGIDCSNIPGEESSDCANNFGAFEFVQLSATPSATAVFGHWTGNDPFGGFFGPLSCNSGSSSPCRVLDQGAATTTVTAFFDCLPPVLLPAAETGATSAGPNFAITTLEGTVDPEGCGLDESYFEYGETIAYGSTTPTKPPAAGIGAGSDPVDITAETDPLEPETTYHYRLVVTNSAGTSHGEDRTFTTGPIPPDNCPNAARRAEQGSQVLLLPDCLAVELASPPEKNNIPVRTPSVSADGSRVVFESPAAIGDPPTTNIFGSGYIASRGGDGWATTPTMPDLHPVIAELWNEAPVSSRSLSPDFSRWLGFAGNQQQALVGIGFAYEAGLGGYFRTLSEPLVPPVPSPISPSQFPLLIVREANFQGASADHSHLYFQPGEKMRYLPGDPGTTVEFSTYTNTYLARRDSVGPHLELLQRDRNDKVWGANCPALLGGIESNVSNGQRNQGAVSADGSRTLFSTRSAQPDDGSNCNVQNKIRILERVETPTGPLIIPLFASECARPALPDPPGPCSAADGDDLYQGASVDQARVYFTTNRQLTDTDVDGSTTDCSNETAVAGCDLYLYDRTRPAGERLVQVSAGEDVPGEHEAGKDAMLYNGLTGISADGSHVYFVAEGVLTADPNPVGGAAQAGKPNLYGWDADSEQMTFVGTLAAPEGLDPGDSEGRLWGVDAFLKNGGTWRNSAYPVPATGLDGGGHEVGGDGHILVFKSAAELAPEDGDGRQIDVYRYDAAQATLECLSCAPGSSAAEPDAAPFGVELVKGDTRVLLGTDFAELHRWVSEDGEVVAFITGQPLVAGDHNGADDVHLWWHGSLARLPGRAFLNGVPLWRQPGLSHDGSTVAYLTAARLVRQDRDDTADVYVARIGGGFPQPPPPQLCQGEECRGKPSGAPELVGAGTAVLSGGGNVPSPPHCKKGKIRRHGKCVRKHVKRRHHKRHDNTNRRAGK
jgi:hypothetical protein